MFLLVNALATILGALFRLGPSCVLGILNAVGCWSRAHLECPLNWVRFSWTYTQSGQAPLSYYPRWPSFDSGPHLQQVLQVLLIVASRLLSGIAWPCPLKQIQFHLMKKLFSHSLYLIYLERVFRLLCFYHLLIAIKPSSRMGV